MQINAIQKVLTFPKHVKSQLGLKKISAERTGKSLEGSLSVSLRSVGLSTTAMGAWLIWEKIMVYVSNVTQQPLYHKMNQSISRLSRIVYPLRHVNSKGMRSMGARIFNLFRNGKEKYQQQYGRAINTGERGNMQSFPCLFISDNRSLTLLWLCAVLECTWCCLCRLTRSSGKALVFCI